MISRILVPVDGSAKSKKAAEYAIDLASQTGASVIFLCVIERSPIIAGAAPASKTAIHTIEPIEDYLKELAEKKIGELLKLCDKKGIVSEMFIKKGHPVREILKLAGKSRSDLIVMGSHGASSLPAAVMGSVSYGVMHHGGKINVLIVRR